MSECSIEFGNDRLKECSGISFENQVKSFAIQGNKVFMKHPYYDEYYEYGEITEQTKELIKGKTKTGTFEIIIKSYNL